MSVLMLTVGVASVSGAPQHWRAVQARLCEGFLFGSAGMAGT